MKHLTILDVNCHTALAATAASIYLNTKEIPTIMRMIKLAFGIVFLSLAAPNYAANIEKLDGYWDCYSTHTLDGKEVRLEEIGALTIDAKNKTYRIKGNINISLLGVVPLIKTIYYEGGKLLPADNDTFQQKWEVYELGTVASTSNKRKSTNAAGEQLPEWKIVSFTDNFFIGESDDTNFTCQRIIR